MNFSGVVLAGGKSSRMGRNKALLRIDGVCLVQTPGQRALTRGVLRDTVRDAGPLAGLHAALAECRSGHLAVVAVDLPNIESAWFARLAKLCTPGVGAVARTRDGYEPLAAIYPSDALAEAKARLESGRFALQQFVATLIRRKHLRVLRLSHSERWQLANWNTPADID